LGSTFALFTSQLLSTPIHKYDDVLSGFGLPNSGRLGLQEIVFMPRRSPFSIVLSKEERIMLETQVRQYTSPYCDVIRAKIVLLAAEGLSNDIIAARLDTPRQIVSKWRKRFALARLPGLEAQPRGGRPAHFSPQRRRPS
jgi:hypothetical protein